MTDEQELNLEDELEAAGLSVEQVEDLVTDLPEKEEAPDIVEDTPKEPELSYDEILAQRDQFAQQRDAIIGEKSGLKKELDALKAEMQQLQDARKAEEDARRQQLIENETEAERILRQQSEIGDKVDNLAQQQEEQRRAEEEYQNARQEIETVVRGKFDEEQQMIQSAPEVGKILEASRNELQKYYEGQGHNTQDAQKLVVKFEIEHAMECKQRGVSPTGELVNYIRNNFPDLVKHALQEQTEAPQETGNVEAPVPDIIEGRSGSLSSSGGSSPPESSTEVKRVLENKKQFNETARNPEEWETLIGKLESGAA